MSQHPCHINEVSNQPEDFHDNLHENTKTTVVALLASAFEKQEDSESKPSQNSPQKQNSEEYKNESVQKDDQRDESNQKVSSSLETDNKLDLSITNKNKNDQGESNLNNEKESSCFENEKQCNPSITNTSKNDHGESNFNTEKDSNCLEKEKQLDLSIINKKENDQDQSNLNNESLETEMQLDPSISKTKNDDQGESSIKNEEESLSLAKELKPSKINTKQEQTDNNSNNDTKPKNNIKSSQPIDFDDIPIHPKQQISPEEEIKEGINQDGPIGEGFAPPKKKPPAKLLQKKPIKKPAFDTSVENAPADQGEKEKKLEENSKNQAFQNNFDDIPISGMKKVDIDEVPIGKSSKFDVSEYPPDYNPEENKETSNPEHSNIPLSDRLKSKVWKIRQAAFEELTTFLETTEISEIIQNYPFSELVKYMADANPGAQEKALSCFKIYLKKRDTIEEDFEEALKILCEKVFVSTKSNIKKMGSEIMLDLYIKAKDRKSFTSSFPSLFNNKNPKTAAVSISTFIEIFQTFGVRKLEFLKPWLIEIEKVAANSTVAGIKQECMNFFKEAYLFLGPDLLRMNTGKLKKTQADELEKFYSENPFTEPKKPLQSVLEEEDHKNESKGDGKKNANKGFDAYEISDPVDIFHKYNEAWTNKVLSFEKWNERKDALEDFLRDNSNVIKISSNQNSTISTTQMMLKRLLMDSNVQVTISAIKIIGFLCKGLRRSFYSQAKALLPFLLDRLREKKGSLLDETQKTLESMLYSLNLEEVFDMVKETLEGKNVQGKINGLVWVEKGFYKGENMSLLKSLMPTFGKLLDDGSSEVRTLMMNVLGRIAGKVANEKGMYNTILKEIPEAKLAKFEEAVKKNTASKEEDISNNNSGVIIPKENIKDKAANTIVKEQNKENSKENSTIENNPSFMKEKEPKKPIDPPKKKTPVLEDSGYEEITNICEEEAERILKEKGLEDLLKGLNHPDWKEKQKTIMTFSDYQEAIFQNLEEFLVVLRLKLKQFKENNLNIMKELFNFLCSQAFLDKIDIKAFNIVSNLIIEKANDAKFSEQITQILCKSAKNINLKWIIPNLLNKLSGKANNNVKIICEILDQINKLILYVSNPKQNPLKELLAFIKTQFTSTNVTIKANISSLLNTLIDLHGKTLITTNLGEIPSNFMKSLKLDEEEKHEESTSNLSPSIKERSPSIKEKPKKNLKEIIEEKNKNTAKSSENTKKGTLTRNESNLKSAVLKNTPKEKATPDLKIPKKSESKASLAPVSDKKISKTLDYDKIFAKMKHKEWNIRKEALEELEATDLGKASNNILNEILNILKTRLTDPNKPLAKLFVVFCGNFCKIIDKDVLKPHYKQLLMSLLANLSDKNQTVRLDIMNTLKILNNIMGQDVTINLISQYYLSNDSPEMKSELLKFICENDLNSEKIEFKHMITPVLYCIIDKNKEIRSNSELLLRKLLEKIGRTPFVPHFRDMKPAQKTQIEAVFEKVAEGIRIDTENNEKSELDDRKSRKSIGVVSREELPLENSGKKETLLSINNPNLNNTSNNSETKPKDFKNSATNNNPNNAMPMDTISENPEENFEELLSKEKALFLKEVTELNEFKILRLKNLEAEEESKKEGNGQIQKKRRLNDDKRKEVLTCAHNVSNCLEKHNAETCALQEILGNKKNSEFVAFEIFTNQSSGFEKMISPWFYQKLYKCNNPESLEFFDGLKFLNKLFPMALSKESCIILQSIDEISDILIQYISFVLLKSMDISEDLVVLALDTLIFLFKIIRFNCSHLSLLDILFLFSIPRVLIDKNLDQNVFIQKTFRTFFLSLICNCKDFRLLQNIIILAFLVSDPNSWSLRYRLLRYLNELIFDYIDPEIELLGRLPEFSSDRESLLRFINKFKEEELIKRGGLTKNQLIFGRKSTNSSNSKTQELDKMINETKNSIIRKNTHSLSIREAIKGIFDNNNKIEDPIKKREEIQSSLIKLEEKKNENLEKISEDLLKNPIVNQQITSEVFIADLRLLEEGNAAEKIDALMFLSDLATSGMPEHGLLFQRHADQILVSFGYVFKKVFSLEMRLSVTERFPLQFMQYFLNMFQKFISAGLFLRYIQNSSLLMEFLEDLLLKMLWEENFVSDNVTEVNSGVMLLKLMNILVLRTLEYGEYNMVMKGLLELLYKYRKIHAHCYKKMYGLIAKCVLKLGKHIGMLKENKQEMEIDLLLMLFYKYLNDFFEEEDLGVIAIKEVLYEIVKSFGENTWEFYKKIQLKGGKFDHLLEKWITMMMKTVTPLKNSENKGNFPDEQIKNLLENIRKKEGNHDENLMKISEIIENYPDIDIESYFVEFDKISAEYTQKSLQRLIFIKKCPWIAEENNIFHKGVNLINLAQGISEKKTPDCNFTLKFLNEKYQEMSKLVNSEEKENLDKNVVIQNDLDEPF